MEEARYHFAAEVSRGARFEFGKNWARFLRVLNDERIAIAECSLKAMLKTEHRQIIPRHQLGQRGQSDHADAS